MTQSRASLLLLLLHTISTLVCETKYSIWLTKVCSNGLCLILYLGINERDYMVIMTLVGGISLCDREKSLSVNARAHRCFVSNKCLKKTSGVVQVTSFTV